MNDQESTIVRQILIIDDNETIHGDFEKILGYSEACSELDDLDAELFGAEDSQFDQSLRFEMTHAMQGKEGLEILQQAQTDGVTFEAAFVDMRMPPGWDGVETIEHLWKVDPHLQVVICTAFSDHSWDEIMSRLGKTDRLLILKKPFDDIEVVQLATSLSEKRRLLEKSLQKVENLELMVGEQAAELQAAHQNAEALLQSISGALVSLDESGNVSHWNSGAAELFEIQIEHAVGNRFTDLEIGWLDPQVVSSMVCNNTAGESKREEVQFGDRRGQSKTLDMHVCRIVDDPTSKSRLIVATDVTRQKTLQSQLNQAQRLESVGQLAAGIAHEINTPMQYIGDNVRYVAKSMERMSQIIDCLPALVDESVADEQLIEIRNSIGDSVKSKKVKSLLKQIPEALADSIEGVAAVSMIVAAMKEFSHPGVDENSQANLNHILESTITVSKNEWKYVADVETDFQESLPDVHVYPSELNQAFLNIVVNAAHAIGDRVASGDLEKGKIEIGTRAENGFACVTIRDTGGGIPKHIRERVFEPFFTTKDVGKGTGQGLAIAHTVIVNKHDGRLSFDVEEGQGTTFTIQIPLDSDQLVQPPPGPSAPQADDPI